MLETQCDFANVGRWPLQESDIFRIQRDSVGTCLVQCSAGADGWSVSNPAASGFLLDSFQRCWTLCPGTAHPAARLRSSLLGAARLFLKSVSPYLPDDPDLVGPPWASVSGLLILPALAYAGWIGCTELHLVNPESMRFANHPTSLRPVRAELISPGQPVRLQTRQWALPAQGQFVLCDFQWPRRKPIEEMVGLLQLNKAAQARWCQQNQRSSFCVLSCTFAPG